jgi:hypothetical protein
MKELKDMTKEEVWNMYLKIEQDYARVAAYNSELRSTLAQFIPPDEDWKPEYGDKFYFIRETGKIDAYTWEGDTEDMWKYNQNNCFITEEKAKDYKKYLNIKGKIRLLAKELNKNNPLDWNEGSDQVKYSICTTPKNKLVLQVDTTNTKHIGQIYCTNQDFLNEAIKLIGNKKDIVAMIKSGV